MKTRDLRCRQVLSMGQVVDQPPFKCPRRKPNAKRRCNKRRCPNTTLEQHRSSVNKRLRLWKSDNDVMLRKRNEANRHRNTGSKTNEVYGTYGNGNRASSGLTKSKGNNAIFWETNNLPAIASKNKKRPSIRSQPNQKYLQKKYMKKVKLKVSNILTSNNKN